MASIARIRHIKELFPFHDSLHGLLGIFAHPDDESLLAGGMFALAHIERIRSVLVTVTQGELGGKYSGIFGKKLAITRLRELAAATRILDIDSLVQLAIPDQGVEKRRRDVRNTLIDIIVNRTPQIIITHDPFDMSQHPDHIAAGRATVDALKKVNPSWPHIIVFAAMKPAFNRKTYALDIDPCRDIKMKACQAHTSQGLFHAVQSSIPIDVYYKVNHFEYFIPYENEKTADNKRHHSDKK